MQKIYVIHGWSYTIDKWSDITSELKKRKIEIIMLKVPGLTTPSDEVWTINSYTDWVYKQLETIKKPITLMGHSNGGRISLNFVQKYPDIVNNLILIDSAGVYDDRLLTQLKRSVLKILAKTGKLITQSPRIRKLFYKAIRGYDYEQAPENMRKTMANLLASDRQLDISRVNIPTHLIWGTDDTVTPPSDGQKINDRIKGSTIKWIKGARHSPFITNPSQVADIIEDILK